MWFSSSRLGSGLNCPNFSAKFCMAALSVFARNFAELHAEKRRRLANHSEFSMHCLQIEGAQVRNISISLWLAQGDV
jgi:hypothetical protein